MISKPKLLASGLAAFDCNRMLIGAVHILFLTSRGVPLKDIATLQVIYSLAVLCLEFPTGLMADRIGNRASVLLACIFTSFFYIAALGAPNMLILALGEILYAIGLCFNSGAAESWLNNITKNHHTDPAEAEKILYYRTEVTSIGNVLCGLTGALCAAYLTSGFSALYMMCFVNSILCLLYLLRIEGDFAHSNRQRQTIAENYRTLTFVFSTRAGRMYMWVSLALTAALQPVYHYWQPLFAQQLAKSDGTVKELPEAMVLGIVFACYAGCKYIVNRFARTFLVKKFSAFNIGWVSAALAGLFLLFVGLGSARYELTIVLFTIFHSAMSLVSNSAFGLFMKTLPTGQTAGILSGISLFSRLGAIGALTLIQIQVQNGELALIFAEAAIAFVAIAAIMVVWKRGNSSEINA